RLGRHRNGATSRESLPLGLTKERIELGGVRLGPARDKCDRTIAFGRVDPNSGAMLHSAPEGQPPLARSRRHDVVEASADADRDPNGPVLDALTNNPVHRMHHAANLLGFLPRAKKLVKKYFARAARRT